MAPEALDELPSTQTLSSSGLLDDGLGTVYFTEKKLLTLPKTGGAGQVLQVTGIAAELPGRTSLQLVGSPAAVTHLLQCVPLCGRGQLQQTAPDGSRPIDLGPIALPGSAVVNLIDGRANLPVHFSTTESSGPRRDAWSLQPGLPGSLACITRHLP